jgi:mRNA-degrading endonuclease RelE of RelBE toxin-antitoxin system
MVVPNMVWPDKFKKEVSKIRDNKIKERLKQQIQNIVECPKFGKPLRYDLKGERTVYVRQYRLIHLFHGTTLFALSTENTCTDDQQMGFCSKSQLSRRFW